MNPEAKSKLTDALHRGKDLWERARSGQLDLIVPYPQTSYGRLFQEMPYPEFSNFFVFYKKLIEKNQETGGAYFGPLVIPGNSSEANHVNLGAVTAAWVDATTHDGTFYAPSYANSKDQEAIIIARNTVNSYGATAVHHAHRQKISWTSAVCDQYAKIIDTVGKKGDAELYLCSVALAQTLPQNKWQQHRIVGRSSEEHRSIIMGATTYWLAKGHHRNLSIQP